MPEVGHYYRTRSGNRAFVSGDVGTNPFRENRIDLYPLIGYIEGHHQVFSWSVDGRAQKGIDRPSDLVKEIPAPLPIKGWIAIAASAVSPISPTRDEAIASLKNMEKSAPVLAVIWIEALAGDGL
ncbi:hypothetical protein HFO89_08620 [Rhizobium leguminosarum]|uniref:hypothetical protein n=1 Tax=Rhizobium leguminosarum TaxID=384 RepID=UPI001C95D2A3|nr:hypothetical protein [Rhizobium leguminosarum]MBY5456419.1 hypothetical protein [Rhizobium leguminosarum]